MVAVVVGRPCHIETQCGVLVVEGTACLRDVIGRHIGRIGHRELDREHVLVASAIRSGVASAIRSGVASAICAVIIARARLVNIVSAYANERSTVSDALAGVVNLASRVANQRSTVSDARAGVASLASPVANQAVRHAVDLEGELLRLFEHEVSVEVCGRTCGAICHVASCTGPVLDEANHVGMEECVGRQSRGVIHTGVVIYVLAGIPR
jgi:hypothetical protein